MAHHKSALKRIRQSAKAHERNRSDKSRMKTFSKKVLSAVAAGDPAVAQEQLREAMSVIAVSARKGTIHKNQAARRISRLNAKVKALATGAPAAG